jgi:hypothetical protein
MQPLTQGRAYAIAIVGGAGLWFVTAAVTGRTEAWDSTLYWVATYPISIALAGWLAYQIPKDPWRWALAVMWAQALALMFASSSLGLLPLGLIVFGVLSLPAVFVAKLAAARRASTAVAHE